MVELVALRVARDKPLTLGLLAGIGIGTIGLAAEWAWSYAWWTIEWPASMLVEGVVCGFVAAVGGGVLGGFIGRALEHARAPAAAGAALRPARRGGGGDRGDRLGDADLERRSGPRHGDARGRRAGAAARGRRDRPARPARTAADDAYWFVATAWQGKEGRSVVEKLEEVSPGVYRTTEPLPVYGNWKTTIRLHQGNAVQGLAVYFPEDKAIPVKGVPAEPSFTRELQARQGAAPARAEVRRARRARPARLPHRAAHRRRPLRLDGLGPRAAPAPARSCRSARVRAAGPSAWGARCRPRPATP